MSTAGFAWHRVTALAHKDARELLRNPGAVIPAIRAARLQVATALRPV